MAENWDDPSTGVVLVANQAENNDWGGDWGNPAPQQQTYQTRTFGGNRRGGQDRREGSNRGERRDYSNGNDKMEVIQVPSQFVGRIIGRGGSKISDLQYNSGARIQVTKDSDGTNTDVKIFGDDEAIAKAKDLIADLTVERQERAPQYKQPTPAPQLEREPPPANITNWQDWLQECEKKEAEFWTSYPPIKKDFYTEHQEVTEMTDQEVEEFRANNNNIVVARTFKTDDSLPIPKPVTTFYQAFHEYPEIMEEIRKVGFEKPSPIQSQAWPVLLSGEDLIGIAQTGTGKTLAFLLPALIHIAGQGISTEERGGPAVLIMAPTRELALQIDKEIKKYTYKGIKSVCLYGGGSRRDQVKECTDGVDIVIATPGRLNDIVQAGQLDVKPVTYAVLDEADRMLDMGFEPQIRKIMYMIRPTRHTVMTSATWPTSVRRMAQSYMKDPIQVYVGSLDLAATHTVTQVIEIMPDDDEEKMKRIIEFARYLTPDQKVIVFCGKKARADDLAAEISLASVRCQTLHGDRDQSDREQALKDIKSGHVQVLIATDLASRGLDIEDITHVINYDFPKNMEEYVHRVGRTGRAGKFGESISFFTRQNWAQAKELITILEEAQQYVPEEIIAMAERYAAWKERKDQEGGSRGGRRGGYGGGGGGGGGGRRGDREREHFNNW